MRSSPATMSKRPVPQGPSREPCWPRLQAKAPIMLIIPGSGPTDRDGNNRLVVRASTYRLLAEGLAARDIATLRIDKRGMFASKAAVTDANAVNIGDYVADVKAWVCRRQADRRILPGCSDTAKAALLLSPQPKRSWIYADWYWCRPQVNLSVKCCGHSFGQIPRMHPSSVRRCRQSTRLRLASMSMSAACIRGCCRCLRRRFRDPYQRLLLRSRQASERCPNLFSIMQGERDIQVGVADAERLKQAAPKAEIVLSADTNHVLKLVTSDDRRANVAILCRS